MKSMETLAQYSATYEKQTKHYCSYLDAIHHLEPDPFFRLK